MYTVSLPLFRSAYRWRVYLALAVCISTGTVASSQTIFRDASAQLPADPNATGTDTVDSDFVDVDGDGDLDIFIAEGTAGFAGRANRLLLNDGRGNFTDVSATNLPAGRPANSLSADFADIDKDGDLDIVVANLGPEQLLLNNGHGVFTDASAQLLPPPPANIVEDISTEVGFVDVNADGRLDIFVTNEIPPIPGVGPGGSQNFLFMHQPDGRFTNESLLRLPNAKFQSGSFAAGDIDRDGDVDIIELNVGEDQVLINNGMGFFTYETQGRLPIQNTPTRAGVLGDVDSDGDLDLMVANSNRQQNQLFLNDGHGVFTDVTATQLPVLNDTSSDVKLFDIDYDGDLDVYFANAAPNPNPPGTPGGGHPLIPAPNVLYINNGNGFFTNQTALFFPAGNDGISFDIEIGDVSGDGLEDFLISNANGGAEQLFIRAIAPPAPTKPVRPELQCVSDNRDGTYTAFFGYVNKNRTAVYIPLGDRNRLKSPFGVPAQTQPVVFLPGTQESVFSVPFRQVLIWFLDRRVAVASRGSRRCNCEWDERANVELQAFPNPASGVATIQYVLPAGAQVQFTLFDRYGHPVQVAALGKQEKGLHQTTVDVSHLKPGLYYCQLTLNQSKTVTQRLICRGE